MPRATDALPLKTAHSTISLIHRNQRKFRDRCVKEKNRRDPAPVHFFQCLCSVCAADRLAVVNAIEVVFSIQWLGQSCRRELSVCIRFAVACLIRVNVTVGIETIETDDRFTVRRVHNADGVILMLCIPNPRQTAWEGAIHHRHRFHHIRGDTGTVSVAEYMCPGEFAREHRCKHIRKNRVQCFCIGEISRDISDKEHEIGLCCVELGVNGGCECVAVGIVRVAGGQEQDSIAAVFVEIVGQASGKRGLFFVFGHGGILVVQLWSCGPASVSGGSRSRTNTWWDSYAVGSLSEKVRSRPPRRSLSPYTSKPMLASSVRRIPI